jgi:hypothetical protein
VYPVSPLPIFVVFFVKRGYNPLNNVYGVKISGKNFGKLGLYIYNKN